MLNNRYCTAKDYEQSMALGKQHIFKQTEKNKKNQQSLVNDSRHWHKMFIFGHEREKDKTLTKFATATNALHRR